MTTATVLASVYDPHTVEKKWYGIWKEAGYFIPESGSSKESFSIVMPPPNVTGQLHLGHAQDNTLQDALSRFKRMQGFNVLWLPGTDHAGIATQAKVEESLQAEGISRWDLGREEFLKRVWDWKHLYGSKITEQLSLLGSSCDWTRERFTMDEGCSRAVREAFVRLYEKGLIYQGDYIINWCPKCHTAISDIEVEHQDTAGKLWYIKYPAEEGDSYLIVATTRPETMLGDTGVAVHPEDPRYQQLIGRNVVLPLMNRVIPVVADEYVDKEFGTGAVKVTPAHDPNDFEIGARHSLEILAVMNSDATMNENAGRYQGMERYECRQKVVEDLEKLGLLVRIDDHQHAVGHCHRCDTTIEPLVSRQWFVKMKPLAIPAIQAVVDGRIKFVPERFTRIYINWMENIRDWCISRQLWWGHRIPVWYCDDCGEMICSRVDPEVCPQCGNSSLRQDEDVLDTWFSSALWPFSTMGWPDENNSDLKTFHPTTVLVTGRDIIFFWVARMIFSGLEFTGQIPFKYVNIHGLIMDALGRKMSKSLGNGIDPIEVIDKFGADTLRFAMVTGSTPGNDIRFHWEKVENTRNFANKIWNASRFVIMNLDSYQERLLHMNDLSMADRWILSRLNTCIDKITGALEAFDHGEAASLVYDFIWDEFCDWYIELVKNDLNSGDAERRQVVQNVLCLVLTDILKLLHPFMPFITEEIYQFLPGHGPTIMLESWPRVRPEFNDEQSVQSMGQIMDVIRVIRNVRSEFNVNPGTGVDAIVMVNESDRAARFQAGAAYLTRLARLKSLQVVDGFEDRDMVSASAVLPFAEVLVPLAGLIDFAREKSRLQKDLDNTMKDLAKIEAKLENQGFLAKAPAEVVAKEQSRQQELIIKRDGLNKRLSILPDN